MSSSDLIAQADSLFGNDDYDEALSLYTKAITLDTKSNTNTISADTYIKRSTCYCRLNMYEESLKDSLIAVNLAPTNPNAYLKQGIAEFNLGQFRKALISFNKGNQLNQTQKNTNFNTWIRKCEIEIGSDNDIDTITSMMTTTTIDNTSSSNTTNSDKVQIKRDYYQTATHVVLTVFIKNANKKDVKIIFESNRLDVEIKLSDSNEYALDIDLYGKIIPNESRYDVLGTKIEIKMKKAESIQWTSLENDGTIDTTTCTTTTTTTTTTDTNITNTDTTKSDKIRPQYPTSNRKQVDWTSYKVEEDKLEGDAATNEMFRKWFATEDEDGQRAMLKSYYESGGTVLTAQWKDVKDKKVECHPPEHMEVKYWNDLHH